MSRLKKILLFLVASAGFGMILAQADNVAMRADNISIRDYVDMRVSELQRATDQAYKTLDSRLAAMNEFRATLSDATAKFSTREQVDLQLKPMQEDIRTLRSLSDIAQGKASQTSFLIAMLFSLVSFIISISNVLSKFRQQDVKKRDCK